MSAVSDELAGATSAGLLAGERGGATAAGESRWLQRALIAAAVVFLTLFLVLPLAVVVAGALDKGVIAYLAAVGDPDTRAAVWLTLEMVAVAVPINTVAGVMAAWAVAHFDFRGKSVVTTLIDLPFAVSPVVAGLAYILVFGREGWLGPWLSAHGVQVVFAVPGMMLATLFVTFPFVARELIPVLQARGRGEEEAALSLGASGIQMFLRVTLPAIRWALLYGVLLTTARAMGEFGAVSVVSGHVPGEMETLTLRVDLLYENYQASAAFAVASLLLVMALITLALKTVLDARIPTAADTGPAIAPSSERSKVNS